MKTTAVETDTLKIARRILPEGACQADIDALAQRLDLAVHRREIRTVRKPVTVARINPFDGNPYQATEYHAGLVLADCAEWSGRNGYAIRPDLAETLALPIHPTPPGPPPPPQWPWGEYQTTLLEILAEAVAVFCCGDEPYPKKGVVVEWIKARMAQRKIPISDDLPAKMETIISPRPYVNHRTPRPKKK
jgi:hypothetical protein